jgi:hypothetical protein
MNSSSRLPLIITALIFAALGYGFGRWQGSLSLEGSPAVASASDAANLRIRADRLEARRQLSLALAAVEAGNPDAAQKNIKLAGRLLKTNSSGGYTQVAEALSSLNVAGLNVPSQKKAITDVAAQMDALFPEAMQAMGGG